MMTLFLMALGALAALLQVSLPFTYFPADAVFLVVVFSGLQRGKGRGLLTGAFAGLILDSLSSPGIGPRLLACAVVGALADALEGSVNREQPRLQVLAVACLSLTHDLAMAMTARALHMGQGGWRHLVLHYVLPRLALHALLAVPVFALFRIMVRAPVFQSPSMRPPRVIRKLPR
ncbi:MAG: rod shape-determining protein MreD [candidate division FCPU426 bacterium]